MFDEDRHRVSENQKLLNVIEEIGWESYQAPDLYLQSAIAKARDATDTEGGIRHRLEKIGQELNDTGLRQRALDYLTQFLGLDGAVDAEATKVLYLAKTALKTG